MCCALIPEHMTKLSDVTAVLLSNFGALLVWNTKHLCISVQLPQHIELAIKATEERKV